MSQLPQELEARIEIALKLYSEQKKPKIAKLARDLDISYQLLRGRVHGRKSARCRIGPGKALQPEEEEALIRWVHTLTAANTPPTAEMIRDCATQMLRRYNTERCLGMNWAYRFIHRLPDDCPYIKQKFSKQDRVEAATPGHAPKGVRGESEHPDQASPGRIAIA